MIERGYVVDCKSIMRRVVFSLVLVVLRDDTATLELPLLI